MGFYGDAMNIQHQEFKRHGERYQNKVKKMKPLNENRLKIIAFDCDGVMFDTKMANMAYYNQILAHFGKPEMTPDQFEYVHMHTVDIALSNLFPDTKSRAAAEAFRQSLDYVQFLRHIKIEPYLKTLLRKLRPGFKTAVVTNRTDTMSHILARHRLGDLFDLVLTALNVPRPKPHPDPLLKLLDHFGATPEQVLYIGDSTLDEQAAKASGISLAAYDNLSLEARYHIKSLEEIEAIVYS